MIQTFRDFLMAGGGLACLCGIILLVPEIVFLCLRGKCAKWATDKICSARLILICIGTALVAIAK